MSEAGKALQEYRAWRDVLKKFIAEDLEEGVDFMSVRNGSKPSLLQPGAQKLARLLGLSAHFDIVERAIDLTGEEHDGKPFVHVLVKCALNDATGVVVSESYGEANSRSPRMRNVAANADNVINTVVKMAQKRAYVGAVTFAAGVSEEFTQDIEDYTEHQQHDTSKRKPANPKRKQRPAQKQQKPDAGAFDFSAWLDRALDHAEKHDVTLLRLAALFGEPFPAVAKRLVTAGKTDAEMTTWFAELVNAVVNHRPVARSGHVYDDDELLFLDYYAANWWPFAEQWNMHPDAEDKPPTFSELAKAMQNWNKRWFTALGKMDWDGAKDWDAVHALFNAEHFSGTDVNAYAVWQACVARTPALTDALRKDRMNQTAQEQRAKEPTKPTQRKKLA